MTPQVGLLVPPAWLHRPFADRERLVRSAAAEVDHLAVGDHVSFWVGAGVDGLTQAAALLAAQPDVPVHTAVYLLPLRHPVPLARTLATIGELAPGRFCLGVGIGGEDRHEIEICGIDPATRGVRADESLTILRGLLAGERVTFAGRILQVEDAVVLPAPDPPIPIVVGGRSDAGVRRAARFGDGWLGIWVSPKRYASVVAEIDDRAAAAGREDVRFAHELNVWFAVGDSAEAGRAELAPAMEAFYSMPFEPFEKYSPYGPPEAVAEMLAPYVEAGCSSFNLIPAHRDPERAIDAVTAVRELLLAATS